MFYSDPLKQAMLPIIRQIPKQYFLSWLSVKKERMNVCLDVYQSLCKLFTSSESDAMFDFGGVFVPKPQTEIDQIIAAVEFADIFLTKFIDDQVFCDTVHSEGPYETEKVKVRSGGVVIDCGANIGLFSAYASGKGAVVYAFEPDPFIIEKYLSKTAEWNPNINICKFALADKDEVLNFAQNHHNMSAGKLTDNNCVSSADGTSFIPVQAITLDMFVQKNNLQRVDFIKADIEGAERYMLMGAKNVLKEFAPDVSLCTYHLPDDPKVLRELILDANPNYVIEERYKKIYATTKR